MKHRLLSLFESVIPEPNSGCWLWARDLTESGYGLLPKHHPHRRAHRASWIFYRGPVPSGMSVLHRCDVRCCINPDHLYLGDLKRNARDVVLRLRSNRQRLSYGAALRILADARPYKEIAAEHGVSPHAIGAMKRGESHHDAYAAAVASGRFVPAPGKGREVRWRKAA